jgi:hypothetical protein
MNIEIIIISTIVFLAALSIVLGIINWTYLSSTSSKISALEGEIEKKAKEFDAIKKEKSQQQMSTHAGKPENADQSASFTGQENSSIEIVRNVRAEFQQAEGPLVNQETELRRQSSGFVKEPAYPPPVAHEPQAPRTDQRTAPATPKGLSGDVLDIVDDTPRASLRTPVKTGEIEVDLFSQAKKDTDFQAAWKKITGHLPGAAAPHVVINFNNVMFLYEKELQYLEKIQDVVSRVQGKTTFINCHSELRPIISSRPSLAQCIID